MWSFLILMCLVVVELNFHEKTLSLQGDERSALSVAMWLVTTFKPEEMR